DGTRSVGFLLEADPGAATPGASLDRATAAGKRALSSPGSAVRAVRAAVAAAQDGRASQEDGTYETEGGSMDVADKRGHEAIVRFDDDLTFVARCSLQGAGGVRGRAGVRSG
ncbi:hypothetical protein MMC19_006977, partial [Ptychographa xylographoides]|nr:hypothetical protein [Ptychographa xylographoides]